MKNQIKKAIVCLACFYFFFGIEGAIAKTSVRELKINQFPTVEKGGRTLVYLSLDQVIRIALQEASVIERIRITKEIAVSKLQAAKEKDHLTWNNNASINQNAGLAETDFDNNSTSPYQSFTGVNTHTISSGLSKQDSNGIVYSMTLTKETESKKSIIVKNRHDSANNIGKAGDATESTTLSVGIDVPLFQDWGDFNDISIRQNEVLVNNEQFSAQQNRESLIEQVVAVYWTLAGQWKSRGTAEQAIALSERLFRETKTKVELGILKPIETPQAEIRLIKDQQALVEIDKKIAKIEDDLKIILRQEGVLFGFLPSDKPIVKDVSINLSILQEQAIASSPERSRLANSIKLNTYEYQAIENDLKPNIDLTARYIFKGVGSGFSSSSDGMGDHHTNDYKIGLNWSVPIGGRQTQERLAQKSLERELIEIRIRDLEAKTKSEIANLVRELSLTKKKIQLSRKKVSLTKALLDEGIENLNLGNNMGYQVTQYQKDYVEAQEQLTILLIELEKLHFSIELKAGIVSDNYLNRQ